MSKMSLIRYRHYKYVRFNRSLLYRLKYPHHRRPSLISITANGQLILDAAAPVSPRPVRVYRPTGL